MSTYEGVLKAIYDDPDVELLSLEAFALYLWSFVNHRCNMAGLYKVSRRAMEQSKVSAEKLPTALDELARARFLYYEDNVLWVRARIKRLPTKGPKIGPRIARDVTAVDAQHPLRLALLYQYCVEWEEEFKWLEPYLAPLNAIPPKVWPLTSDDSSRDESSGVRDESSTPADTSVWFGMGLSGPPTSEDEQTTTTPLRDIGRRLRALPSDGGDAA